MDSALVDLKCLDDDVHRRLTGTSGLRVKVIGFRDRGVRPSRPCRSASRHWRSARTAPTWLRAVSAFDVVVGPRFTNGHAGRSTGPASFPSVHV